MTDTLVKSGNHFISQSQASMVPPGLNHTLLQIPSTTAPAFNAWHLFTIQNKGIKIHEAILQLTPSAITGISAAPTSYPCFIPGSLMIDHLELLVNGTVMNTQYGLELWIRNQLFNSDENRLISNQGEGDYLSVATRNTLSNGSNSIFINLKTLFNECHYNLLRTTDDISLRVYMKPVSAIVSQSTGTGTPIATLNASNLILKVTQLDQNSIAQQLAFIAKTPRSFFFNATKYGSYSIQQGVTSANLILAQLAGNVTSLFFVVRPTSSTTGESTFSFSPIQNFNILDSAGNSLVGGSVIPTGLNQLMMKGWTQSSYISEYSRGISNSYVYMYAFSPSPIDAQKSGAHYGAKTFMGQEQLILTWVSSTSTPLSVDVFSFNYSAIVQSATTNTLSTSF